MPDSPSTRLLWAVHCHQPVGNFDFVFANAFDSAYDPFVRVLERHPSIGVDFHFSGILLDWLDKNRPEYLDRVGKLVESGQCGLLAGAYYEPILPPIPFHDQVGQIVALRKRLKERFGVEPTGMWLAERVWEPGLPAALAQAGIEYTLLDGTHFKQVGFGEEALFGRWLTESEGKTVSVYPIHDGVRDLIPFSEVERAVQALRDLAVSGGRDVVFGDDGEKFGDWPGTHQLCYTERWLERFFEEVERDPSLSVRPVSEAYGTSKARGMAYLPAASYFEMMEWAESAPRQRELASARKALKAADMWDGIAPFVRGVSWRNFLVRYPESNRMHKMASRLSRLVREELESGKHSTKRKHALLEARDHIWQAQCNCGYWHGVFGGLYLPHLRRGIHGHLARAESLLRDGESLVGREDWDLDGTDEVVLASGGQFLSIHSGQGGIIPLWYLDKTGLNLSDSMTRGPEAYHARITGEEGKGDGTKLADQFEGQDPELAAALRYDDAPRASGLVWWFPEGSDVSEWSTQRKADHWVGGGWETSSVRRGHAPSCELRTERDGMVFRRGLKLLAEGGVEAILLVENTTSEEVRGTVGIEWMVNLLAGDAHDRWIRPFGGEHARMGTTGSGEGGVDLADEWLQLKVKIDAGEGSRVFWHAVHTVNQSVGGYEKVYQGTSILSSRELTIPAGGISRLRVVFEIHQPDGPAPL
ncbi:MAG: hypothetical protein RL173_3387 [Fibrobacterota bacterium]|jgi:hypothetical protein